MPPGENRRRNETEGLARGSLGVCLFRPSRGCAGRGDSHSQPVFEDASMRNLCKVSLSLALVALLAAPALAQPPGGFGFGGPLLLNKSVQDELKLSKETKGKLEEVNKKAQEKRRELFQGGFDREKFQALNKEITEEANKAANLNDDQKKRLKEIELQQRERFGPAVFTEAEVQKQLKLTDEQKDAIKTIVKETQEKIREETKDLDMQDFRK